MGDPALNGIKGNKARENRTLSISRAGPENFPGRLYFRYLLDNCFLFLQLLESIGCSFRIIDTFKISDNISVDSGKIMR